MFPTFEISRDRGSPVELFLATYGDRSTDYYAYTDFERDITLNIAGRTRTFVATPIERSDIETNGTLDRAELTVSMFADADLPRMFRIYPPSHVVTLQIYQGHFKDSDQDFRLLWDGRILSAQWQDQDNTAQLACEPIITSLRRPGLRRNYQYGCTHALYDPNTCRANKANATTNTTTSGVGSTTIAVNMSVNSNYIGGLVQWTNANNGLPEYRTILNVSDSTNELTLAGRIQGSGLNIDQAVAVSFGCNHTMDHCVNLHNNEENFGGCPWIPTKNPAGATSPYI